MSRPITVKEPRRRKPDPPPQNRIIKRFGGRHLIFRTKIGGWPFVPHSYLLISAFRGPVWVFYGIGQIWLTHRKNGQIGGWTIRSPRLASKQLLEMMERLRPQLEHFIEYCKQHAIEGTIVLEKRVVEFHWTFGHELPGEQLKPEHSADLEPEFRRLVDAFEPLPAEGEK